MLVDYHIHTFLCKHATGIPDEYVEAAIRNGMETLFENAFGLFKKGLITLEEVLRVTSKE